MSILSAGTSNTTSLIYTGDTTGAMVFQTNGTTEAMRIDTSQRVGIGITNPGASLDVKTNIFITENSVASSNTELTLLSRFSDNQRGYVILKAESNSSGSSDLVIRSRNNFSEAEKFRIDSVGRVTKPYQPSFWAYLTGAQTVLSGNRLIAFNATRWDVGSNFNTSTNRFTAPVTGKYMFAASVATNGSSGLQDYFGVQFYLNGVQYVVSGWNRQDVGGYLLDSKTTLLSLNAGDYVTVIVESQNGFTANYTTTGSYFTGYLIG